MSQIVFFMTKQLLSDQQMLTLSNFQSTNTHHLSRRPVCSCTLLASTSTHFNQLSSLAYHKTCSLKITKTSNEKRGSRERKQLAACEAVGAAWAPTTTPVPYGGCSLDPALPN